MRTQRTVTPIVGGVPFELDLLNQDLESHFPNFGKGRPISWGLAVGALPGSWDETVRIEGTDWDIRFYPPKELKVPWHARSESTRTAQKTIRQHCALFIVRTDKLDINGARDLGRPAVRSLVALVRREVPVLLPAEVLWEGAVAATPRGRLRMSTASLYLEPRKPIGSKRLHRMGLRLARVSTLAMPPQVRRALEWLSLARSARVRPEKFIHLWLAILALASYGQPSRDSDIARISRYTATMGYGIGSVRSPLSIAELNERLRKSHRIRTALVHRDDDSQITPTLLESLEADAFELIDFELAKIGAAIPDND